MGTATSSPASGRGEAGKQATAVDQQQQDNGGPWEVDLAIPFEEITDMRPLADGTGCTCWQGTLGGNNKGNKRVAIKMLKASNSTSDSDAEDLDRELSILQHLRHPNVVRLAGAGQTPEGGRFVATELLSGGTLSAAIGTQDRPEGTGWFQRFHVRTWFPMDEALRQAAGVASALAYLHDEAVPRISVVKGAKVLHRDIKPTNLAFTADFRTLKLFDFGLAKMLRPDDSIGDNLYTMTGNTGSMRYMAPEVARNLPANETADVYSFAIVLWEMVSLEMPFQFYGVKQLSERVVFGGDRPRLAPEWPTGFTDLLTRCWSADLSERPSMTQVEKRLREVLTGNN
ncbi:unnamed protein product [Ectocarpus sp. 4 AP-2014]